MSWKRKRKIKMEDDVNLEEAQNVVDSSKDGRHLQQDSHTVRIKEEEEEEVVTSIEHEDGASRSRNQIDNSANLNVHKIKVENVDPNIDGHEQEIVCDAYKKIKTAEHVNPVNLNDDRKQQDGSMVWIKQEIGDDSDDHTTSGLSKFVASENGGSAFKIEQRSVDTDFKSNVDDQNQDGVQKPIPIEEIKDEITIEEAKVEDRSEFDRKQSKRSCKFCDFKCSTKVALKTHIEVAHPDERMTRCSICRIQVIGMSQFEKHISDEHQGLECECNICLAQFKKVQALEHKSQCPGRLLFDCVPCGKSFVKRKGLLKHLGEHGLPEDEKDSLINEARIKEQIFSCVICEDHKAYRKDLFWEHVKEQHDGHYLRCPDCGKTFKSHGSRFAHVKLLCKVGSARERFIAEELQCPHCPKTFQNRSALENHTIRLHKRKKSRCDACDLEFSSRDTLRYHRIKVHTEPSLTCSICSQKFHFENTFQRHMEAHQNRRQILCEKCGLGFNNPSHLASHVRSHKRAEEEGAQKAPVEGEDQRKYFCDECGKKFSTNAAMHSHFRTAIIHRKPGPVAKG